MFGFFSEKKMNPISFFIYCYLTDETGSFQFDSCRTFTVFDKKKKKTCYNSKRSVGSVVCIDLFVN